MNHSQEDATVPDHDLPTVPLRVYSIYQEIETRNRETSNRDKYK